MSGLTSALSLGETSVVASPIWRKEGHQQHAQIAALDGELGWVIPTWSLQPKGESPKRISVDKDNADDEGHSTVFKVLPKIDGRRQVGSARDHHGYAITNWALSKTEPSAAWWSLPPEEKSRILKSPWCNIFDFQSLSIFPCLSNLGGRQNRIQADTGLWRRLEL